MPALRRSSIAILSGGLAIITLAIGCTVTDQGTHAVLAFKGEWTIVAIGSLEPSRSAFVINQARFEILRNGNQYATGDLYDAAANDRAFNQQYGSVEWQQANAVRFWRNAPERPPRVRLTVRNIGQVVIRWVRVRCADLGLVFDVQPGNETTVSLSRFGDISTMYISGQLENNVELPRQSYAFDENTLHLVVEVEPYGLKINSAE
jgi:hypothetical protein